MCMQVQMPQNATKNIFRDKQILKKVPVMFLDIVEPTQG